jgi:hypothetical protein
MIVLPNAVEIRDGWKLYIVAGGVMVRISRRLRLPDFKTIDT